MSKLQQKSFDIRDSPFVSLCTMNDIFSCRKDAREIKDEKKFPLENRPEKDEHRAMPTESWI